VIPLDERIVIPAVNHGVPFMLEHRAQPVSRGVFAMAEALRSKLASLEAVEAPTGKR
jgi:hypothetical protein